MTHQRLSFTFDDLHFKIEETEVPTVFVCESMHAASPHGVVPGYAHRPWYMGTLCCIGCYGQASVRKASGASTAVAALDSAQPGSGFLGGDGGPGSPVAVSHTPRLGLSALSMVEEWTALQSGGAAARPAGDSVAPPAEPTSAPAPASDGAHRTALSEAKEEEVPAVSSETSVGVAGAPVSSVPGAGAGAGAAAGIASGRRLGGLPTPLVRAPHFVAPMLRLGTVDPVGRPCAAQPPQALLCGLTKVCSVPA